MKKSIKQLLNYLFPRICVVCKNTHICSNLDLCNQCKFDLPRKIPGCMRCHAHIFSGNICGNCIQNPPFFTKLLAAFPYQNPIDFLITQLKFSKKINLANLLGKLLLEYLGMQYKLMPKPEIIIPIPLHKKRLKERGFNQALEIARPIAKSLEIKIDKYSCDRIINTKMQATLPAKERVQNIKNAFAISVDLKYKHVAIIDDVYTTGNTINEFCKVLKKRGVQKIDVWCVARGVKLC